MNVAAADEVVDVVLRDGGTLRLRPPTSADSADLLEFFARLSDRSRYLRFHGVRRVDDALVAPLVDETDPSIRALIGTLEGRIVALASYVHLGGSTSAEMAFAVADDQQGRGIGTRLLEQLAMRARADGIDQFVAEVMADNRQALGVFADAGFEVAQQFEQGEVELRFPVESTESLQARIEERDHTAVVASLRPFFEPKTVAVIGASRRRGSIGGELFRNVLDADFTGAVYPVNRNGDSVAGVRGYRTVAEIDDTVDLAVICVPGEQVIEATTGALDAGTRAICVISSGFAETGSEGAERQRQLLGLVRAHGARLIGPNCLGLASTGIGLNATFAPRALPTGRIGFSSQSGALGLALLEQATERQLGFSSFVSIGNKADVSSNDLLEWWEDDEGTERRAALPRVVRQPAASSRRIARRVARRKPIIALKAGATATGAHAASSHTAALAGSDAAADALFRQAGVIRARTLEELVDVTGLLSNQPLPTGRRVAVVTNAGGLGILCADACEGAGLELPELAQATRQSLLAAIPAEASVANPVDLLGSATAATYETVLPPLLADPGIDALIVLFVPPVVADAEDVAEAIGRAVCGAGAEKPVLAVVISRDGIPTAFREPGCGVATFLYPESAARALGSPPSARTGCGGPSGSRPLPRRSTRPRDARSSNARSRRAKTSGWTRARPARC